MVDALTIGFVVAGAVLLFFGAALSKYGVGFLGVVLGGGGGYLVAPTIAEAVGVSGLAGTVVAILVGALVGLAITYALLNIAIATMGFLVGTYLGVVVVNPIVGGGSIFVTILAGLGTGVLLAFLGMFLSRTTMVLITSFIGAALASTSVTLDNLNEAADQFAFDPIVFEVTDPLFAGLFVLGVLTQFGLFRLGWVAKIVTFLPGAIILDDERDG